MRVALLPGCAQQVLAPEINEATIRLLTRHGCEVVVAAGSGCCGSLAHHLGQEDGCARLRPRQYRRLGARAARRRARRDRDQCLGLRHDGQGLRLYAARGPAYAAKAARIAALARDVTEVVEALGLGPPSPDAAGTGWRVAYHSACSMQHGQRLHAGPKALLVAAGFEAVEVPEGHLCCGSAGTYNLLQPELARRCASASSPTSPKPGPTSSPPAISAASPSWRRAARCRSCTRSSCSTGRPAARRRARSRRADREAARRDRDQQRQGEGRSADQGRREPVGLRPASAARRRRQNRHRRSSSAAGRGASRARRGRAAAGSAQARN